MAIYPVKNSKTGEMKELQMTLAQYEEWRDNHPDWDKDWQAGVGKVVSGVGDYQDKLPDGIKDRLRNVKKHQPYAKFEAPYSKPVKDKKQPSMVGLTRRQMKRKPINSGYLTQIKPLTPSQEKVFDAFSKQKNLYMYGAAGTGKTFIGMYLALQEILNEQSSYDKLYIVRSLVPTREIGFLPGDHEDKAELYQIPYQNMVRYMFKMPDDASFDMLYANLKAQETISFWSTSFLRGTTLDNAIVLVDEMQNLNFHELDSIITRLGVNTKIIFAGDAAQTDLVKTNERNGILDFMKIIQGMDEFEMVEFGIQDIVRSGLVKSYLINKLNLGL